MRASFIATAGIVIVSLSAPTAAELNVPVAARVISFLQLPPSESIQSAAQQLALLRVNDALGIDARLGYRFSPHVAAYIAAENLTLAGGVAGSPIPADRRIRTGLRLNL